MRISLIDVGRKIAPRALQKLERHLGYSLPADYKDFLCEYNGGQPGENAPCRFWVQKDSGWQESVEFFYGVAFTKQHGYLPFVWHRDFDYMPRQLFPIARTRSGEPLYLGLSEGLSGRVFFSSSIRVPSAVTPMSTDAEILADKGAIEVAGSFREFLDNLF